MLYFWLACLVLLLLSRFFTIRIVRYEMREYHEDDDDPQDW